MKEIPKFALRVYALLWNKFGKRPFSQEALIWLVSSAMKKKIFFVLSSAGWIKKIGKRKYICIEPAQIFKGLFEFRVPKVLKKADKEYCYSKMSAVEIWTDFSYIQRSWEHSPYFIKILKKDLAYWQTFLAHEGIPSFLKQGSYIGEFIIFEIVNKLKYTYYNGFPVEPLKETAKFCQTNSLFEYAFAYLIRKFKLKVKAEIEKRILEKVKEAI